MSKLSREDVLKLARLARLDLTENEIEQYRRELSEILQYVAQLQSADVTGLKPTNQVTGLVNVMREDSVYNYGYTPGKLFKNVPASQGNQIKVKRMIG